MTTQTSSTTPKTKPGTSAADPLIPGARHAIAPKGITATAWPKVKATCQNIGWRFDPWQDATGRLILAKKDGGGWAADLSILSIPRQVGKSYLLGCIIFALCLLNPKLRVIWTSHHTATTEEMYEAMKELAQHKRVAPHVVKCVALQGSRWRIVFRNGSRIDFGARSQGFGRGKAKVGVLVLDEFQHITGRALANLAPTTNQSDNPLILCAGTPPGPQVSGEAFRLRRRAALEGFSDDTLYVEFSADGDAEPDDRKQWTKANPSFPKRTRERAFLLMKKMLDEDDFRREALGIWDDEAPADTAIDLAAWVRLKNAKAKTPKRGVLAVDVAPDRRHSTIAVAGEGTDGKTLVIVRHSTGTSWVVPEVVKLVEKRDIAEVVLHPGSQAGALVTGLAAAGIAFTALTTTELGQACALFQEDVAHQRIEHVGQAPFDAAIANGRTRRMGEAERWDRREPGIDISPLVAASEAAFAWAKYASAAYDPMDSFG